MEFNAVLQKHEGMDAVFVKMPFDVQKEFGQKRVAVLATFDGVPYRGSIVTMQGCALIGVTKEIRRKIGKNAGDEVRVTVKRDEEPRTVEVPGDFSAALNENAAAAAFFKTLSFTNQKNYVNWIESAKTQPTREKRIRESVEMLINRVIRR